MMTYDVQMMNYDAQFSVILCLLQTLFAYPVKLKDSSPLYNIQLCEMLPQKFRQRTLTCKGSATDMVTEPKPISLPSPDGYVCGYEPGSVLNYPQT